MNLSQALADRDEINRLTAALAAAEAERDEARAFGEQAAAKYNALIAQGPTLTCAFCGEAYPPGTPATQHEALTAHVMVCAKHPLASALATTRAEVGRLRGALEKVATVPVDGRGMDYYWKGREIARAALAPEAEGR